MEELFSIKLVQDTRIMANLLCSLLVGVLRGLILRFWSRHPNLCRMEE